MALITVNMVRKASAEWIMHSLRALHLPPLVTGPRKVLEAYIGVMGIDQQKNHPTHCPEV